MKTKKKKAKKIKLVIKPMSTEEYKQCFYGPKNKCLSCE